MPFALQVMSKNTKRPVQVFDRGSARAKYVIEFLKAENIHFAMQVCRTVDITHRGSRKKLDDMPNGWYPEIFYHTIPDTSATLYH